MIVSSSVESNVLPVDKDSSLVVNGIKIQQDLLAVPRRRYFKMSQEPRIEGGTSLNAWMIYSVTIRDHSGLFTELKEKYLT